MSDSIRVESISPNHCQSPLRHDIRENKNRAQILFEFEIRARYEVSENTAVHNRNKTSQNREDNRVQQGKPKVNPGKFSRKQINPVVERVLAFL